MIGEPMENPRDKIISELEKYKNQYLSAGNEIQKIPTGTSGYKNLGPASNWQKLQQAERAKLAPSLRKHAQAGKSLRIAARALKIPPERAKLISKENGIIFQDD